MKGPIEFMKDKKTIQKYVKNFRRRLSSHLKPGVGLTCDIHPAEEGGVILEFFHGPGIENDDQYKEPSATVSAALSLIPQHAFSGNLEGFKFSGTSVVLEKDRIMLIKDDSPAEWTAAAAKHDVFKILPKLSEGKV